MSAPPGRRSPGVGNPGSSQSVSADVVPSEYDSRPTWSAHWQRVRARRRAQRELNAILGVRDYPDPHELYGPTPALARMLEAEAS